MHVGGTSSRLVHLGLGPVPWQDRAGYVLATGTVHLFSGGNAQLSCVHRVTGPREARLLTPQLISALACGNRPGAWVQGLHCLRLLVSGAGCCLSPVPISKNGDS